MPGTVDPQLPFMDNTTATTGARVTSEDVEANIAAEHYFTAADGVRGGTPPGLRTSVPPEHLGRLTFCVLTTHSGFVVTGESACVSAENFDAALGRKYAREQALDKLWAHMGYALRERLHGAG